MALKFRILFVVGLAIISWANGENLDITEPLADPHKILHPNWFSSTINENLDDMTKYDYLSPVAERNPDYWRGVAAEAIKKRTSKPLNLNQAKNVIMFLGDGMSMTTVTAARILKGQQHGSPGEEESLSFEKFPFTGLSKTYCANAQVPDSACTATAYLCGVKTNIYTIGVNANVNLNNCSAAMDPANQVSSIAAWAQAAGKSTGILTTTTLTHASPTGAYGHVANRFWECDADVSATENDPETCTDLAEQLITQEPGRNFDVMLGGGMGKFLPNTIMDLHGKLGEREDGKNLLSQWQGRHPGGVVINNRAQLLALNASSTLPTHLIGLFQSGVMDFRLASDPIKQPTLEEMTEIAIKMLSRNDNGYFVFIEGGLIDYGNHYNVPGMSLDETLELSKAVQKAVDMTNSDDTLIVVTADHAHPLSFSGYPGRGNNILDLNEIDRDVNGIKYSTLQYTVGLNQYLDEKGQRIDLTGQFGSPDFIFPSYVSGNMGVHGGDDVGIFALGPQAHLFSGSTEQSNIPHLMAYAACIGNGPTLCNPEGN